MQYPVPQFTDVEDKIIGPLSIKQFLILFGAGMIVFLIYTATKSLPITIFMGVLIGLPAIAVSFVKINGRAMYKTFPIFVDYFLSDKLLIFHKEALSSSLDLTVKNAETKSVRSVQANATEDRNKLEQVNKLLRQQAEEQEALFKKD